MRVKKKSEREETPWAICKFGSSSFLLFFHCGVLDLNISAWLHHCSQYIFAYHTLKYSSLFFYIITYCLSAFVIRIETHPPKLTITGQIMP